MVFCFGIYLALYAVFSTRIYLQHIAWTVESDRPLNIMFVHLSIHFSIVYECRTITLQPLGIDLCNFKVRSRKDMSHQDYVE